MGVLSTSLSLVPKKSLLVTWLVGAYFTSPSAALQVLVLLLRKIPYYALRALLSRFIPGPFMKDVSKDTVMITGSASGIGRLLALEFAKLGSRVVLADVNKDALEKVRGELAAVAPKGGQQVSAFAVDLSDSEDTNRAMRDVKKEVGDVSILVNNAGIVTGKKLLDCPDDLMKKTMAVNTDAHFWTVKAVLPAMMEKNHGHIVTISSSAGTAGVPGLADYCASKWGAFGFDESVRLELKSLGKTGVKTTVVCPFFIKTGMFLGATTKWPKLLPMLEPEYVAMKIMRAIRCNQDMLCIPVAIHLAFFARALLPTPVLDEVGKFLGLDEVMSKFDRSKTGRA